MELLSSKLASMGDGMYRHFCPGCKRFHYFSTIRDPEFNNPIWEWNGDPVRVTIHPSMWIYTEQPKGIGTPEFKKIMEKKKEDPSFKIPYERRTICHYWLKDGMITYLEDSAHELKGQTVVLPEFPRFQT